MTSWGLLSLWGLAGVWWWWADEGVFPARPCRGCHGGQQYSYGNRMSVSRGYRLNDRSSLPENIPSSYSYHCSDFLGNNEYWSGWQVSWTPWSALRNGSYRSYNSARLLEHTWCLTPDGTGGLILHPGGVLQIHLDHAGTCRPSGGSLFWAQGDCSERKAPNASRDSTKNILRKRA